MLEIFPEIKLRKLLLIIFGLNQILYVQGFPLMQDTLKWYFGRCEYKLVTATV